MRETIDQLTDGYEYALDSLSELTDTLSDVQESVVDTLSDVHGDLQSLLSTLRMCVRMLHQATKNQESNTIF